MNQLQNGQSMLGSNQQKDPNKLFSLTRVWDNAPKGYEKSKQYRAKLIVMMIANEKLALQR